MPHSRRITLNVKPDLLAVLQEIAEREGHGLAEVIDDKLRLALRVPLATALVKRMAQKRAPAETTPAKKAGKRAKAQPLKVSVRQRRPRGDT